jgi:hypothetical protein
MKIGTCSMRTLVGAGALAGAAFGLAACHPPHIHRGEGRGWSGKPMSVGKLLICPLKVGALSRTARTADGQACDYKGPDGEQAHLQRLDLAGQAPQAALAPIEAALRPLIPARAGPDPVDAGDGADDGHHAKVDLPGIHIKAQGDKAEVRVFGITVNADGENADVNMGQGETGTVVQAGANGAEIRFADVEGGNARLMLALLADKAGPSGLHAVGYLARGPVAGPLVVASFKSAARHQDWRRDAGLNALLDLNVKQ